MRLASLARIVRRSTVGASPILPISSPCRPEPRRRHAHFAAKARRKRAEALEADGEANLGDAQIRLLQQRLRPRDPQAAQILVWCLPEDVLEEAVKVVRGQTSDPGQG